MRLRRNLLLSARIIILLMVIVTAVLIADVFLKFMPWHEQPPSVAEQETPALTSAQRLWVQVYFADEYSPLPNALVTVYSPAGVPLGSQCTNRAGLTAPFLLQPIPKEKGYYRIDVIANGKIIAETKIKLEEKSGTTQVVSIITSQELGEFPTACFSWD